MRILKPFISKSLGAENSAVPQQSVETPTSTTNALPNDCKIVFDEAFKKRQKAYWKQYKKEHKEKFKELKALSKEHKELLRKQRREMKRQNHSAYFDPYMAERARVNGGSSHGLTVCTALPSCSVENWQHTTLQQKLNARRSIQRIDSGNGASSPSRTSDGSRSMLDTGSKLRFGKINLRPATRVKDKFTQYRSAFISSSSSQKLHKEDTLPELHRSTSQTSLETITAVQRTQSESTSVQSRSSGSSSLTEYELSNSTSNATNATVDELTESFSSLETQSLTDYSLRSEQSSISSAYSFSSLPPSLSNDFHRGDGLNSELSSINNDFIEFNQRFEVMHNLNPTIPIRHQRLVALNSALPERLNSMTASVSTFSTRSELEFSDVETYQTERNDEGDENDNVRIMVRGEEQD
jgi:hypothetical protein